MLNIAVNCSNIENIQTQALTLLKANCYKAYLSEFLHLFSITYLFPALAFSSMFLGCLGYTQAGDDIGKYFKNLHKRYCSNIMHASHTSNKFSRTHANVFFRKQDFIQAIEPATAITLFNSFFFEITALPLFLSSALVYRVNSYNKFGSKNYI